MTEEISIPFRVASELASDPWGNQRVTFQGDLTLDRARFGIVGPRFWSKAIGDQVTLHFVASGRIYNFDRWGFHSDEKPSVGEAMWAVAETEGAEAALATYETLAAGDRSEHNFDVNEIRLVGLRLLQRERPAEALKIFEVVLAGVTEDKQEALLQIYLGTAHYRLQHFDQAVASFERALELHPRSTYSMEMLRHLRAGGGT